MACLSWSSWPPRPFQEVDERNAKLLQTLSEATDMLAKADEMQVPANAGRTTAAGCVLLPERALCPVTNQLSDDQIIHEQLGHSPSR